MEKENIFPRRNGLDLNTPAELSIWNAMLAVENLPPDVRLTNAGIKLQEAKDLVSDFVDGIELKTRLKPKTVCYCGSLRVAMEAFKKAEYEAVVKGVIALLPCCMFVDIERQFGVDSEYKRKADEVHKLKIDVCDEVFVLNVGGYIGDSTRSEIEYAIMIGKPVFYLEATQ